MGNRSQRQSFVPHAIISLIAAVILQVLSPPVFAGGGPENVAVVINGDSWASKTIANEFIRLRAIPPSNVIVLNDLPGFETVAVEAFRERILKPVLATIDQRGLKEQIDYVVYSSDLPYAIDVRADLAGRKTPRVLTLTASINGLTHLHEPVLAKDANYLQLNSNRYMRRPVVTRKLKPIAAADRRLYAEAARLIAKKKWSDAEKLLAPLAEKYPGQSSLPYNRACCLARMDKPADALTALGEAVAAGWANAAHAKNDADLKPLRDRKEFPALLKKMEANSRKTFDVQPTLAFHSRDRWNERGGKVKEGGRRYLLSTMLAVTSGRGNSVSEAIRGLRQSAAADFNRPAGTIYFLTNGNVRSRTREPGFRSAAAALKKLGVKVEIIKGVLPEDKQDVAGAMIGTASFNWRSSKSTILPGAICEHLTSFGGVMRERAGQTPLTEFLRHGAAASSGTVTEPFAIQAKFPFAFLHVHYARGCSLAEAFYQSVAGPYQLLIVGDPLCQPWAKRTAISVTGLKPGATIAGIVNLAPTVTGSEGGRLELFIDGRRVQTIRPREWFTIDTRKLSDGFHEARVVAIRGDAIESQSRLILPFAVNNHAKSVSLTSKLSGNISWNKRVRFDASAKGAKSIVVMHNHRRLGTIAGDSGHIDVSPLELGSGPVRVSAVAMIDGQRVHSAPLTFTVVAPPALSSVAGNANAKTAAGLLLAPENGKPVVIESTHERNWLSKHGLKPRQPFTLTGDFQVDENDVYQFQFRGNGTVEITVDGQRLQHSKVDARRWRFVPVHLKKGRHRFELHGTAVKNPSLAIRFGGRGAQSLNGKRFRHRVPN